MIPLLNGRSRFVSAPLAALAVLASSCGTPPGPGSAPSPVRTAAPLGVQAGGARTFGRRRPNIVFVLTDDLDAESAQLMPKTQALIGAQGVTFVNAFASTPLCCPSRASLLTGQYAHNHGVLTNGGAARSCFEEFRDAGRESAALPLWLKAAGYRTGFIGKYLNRYPGSAADSNDAYIPPGWDDWHATFAPRGSESCPSCTYYDYSINDNGDVASQGTQDSHYITDVETTRALAFLRGARAAGDAPFFLWVSFTAPHVPATPARRHEGSQADKHVPRGPAFNEEDVDDKPAWFRGLPLLGPDDVEELDFLYRQRLESLMAVDEAVELIVNQLAALGELEDTYIVFSSDNGFLLGQHRFPGGKAAVYEESVRVPLLARGPGIARGARQTLAALNIDLPATFADIAQATPADAVDGRSLLPLFGGGAPAWRSELLLEFEGANTEGLPSWAAVRTGDSIFVDYPAVAEAEFYDLARDPWQLENRSRTLDREREAAWRARLLRLQDCRGATCRQ